MAYNALFSSIRALTDKSKLLAQNEGFEQCFELVAERQKLLERLGDVLEEKELLNNIDIKAEYISLLKYIQYEDKIAVSMLTHQRNDLLSHFKHQSRVKTAINAYHNVLISK